MMTISYSGKNKSRLILFAIVVLAASLRIFHLDAQSFFHDEAVQYHLATRPVATLAAMSYTCEVLPPGSMLALHFWLLLGNSDFWIRLLFALAGIANVVAIFWLARELVGPRVGLLAALLMAVNPFHVWYSQEARPYVFLMLLCTIHVWFFLRAIRQPGWGNWLGFGICALGALYSHPFAAFTLGVEFLYAFCVVRDRRFWVAYFPVGMMVLVCFAPYIFTRMFGLSEVTLGSPKPISWIVLPFSVYTWLFGFSVGPSVTELHWHLSAKTYVGYIFWMVPTLLAVGLLAWGWWVSRVSRFAQRRITWLLAGWIMVPLVAVFALSKVTHGTFNVRYVCEAFLPFIILMAWGLDSLFSRKFLGAAVLFLLLLGAGISLARVFTLTEYWKEDVRSAGQLLNQQAAAGDLILVPETFSFTHYYKGDSQIVPISVALDLRRKNIDIPRPTRQIWLVYYREWRMDPDHIAKQWLDSNWTMSGEYSYPNCKVFRYCPR